MFLNYKNSEKHFKTEKFLFLLYLWFSSFSITSTQFHIPTDNDGQDRLKICHLPTGRPSYCVPLNRCNQINSLLSSWKQPASGDVNKYIKDSWICPGGKTVCCQSRSITSPKLNSKQITDLGKIRKKEDPCSVQDASKTGTCTVYFKCDPLLQLLSNLKQPLPKEIPQLMKGSVLCGRENIGGLNLPKVCCPTEAVTLTDQEKFERHKNRAALTSICPIDLSKRIVGGEEAPIGAYPWLALLGYTAGGSGKPQWKCGGALIGDQYVLTAAHCVTGLPGSFQLAKVRLGEHTISNPGVDCDNSHIPAICNDGIQDFDVEKIISHPDYNSPNVFQNDIAIIKLSRKVIKNHSVKPICLPYEDNEKEDYHFNSQGDKLDSVVAGWGATDPRGKHTADSLQEITLNVFDGKQCRETYKKRGGTLSEKSQLCVGGEKGRDSCVGDSGSALMTSDLRPGKVLDTWRLIGIVSFGPRVCGTENVPGVYSRVRHYIDWILDSVEP